MTITIISITNFEAVYMTNRRVPNQSQSRIDKQVIKKVGIYDDQITRLER